MANEKVYVGKDGAKELYRKIKALIPGAVTVVDYVSLESMDAVTSHAVALAIGNLTGFQTVAGTDADNHPDVDEPNTRTIYLVKIQTIPGEDKYKEWIWVVPSQGDGRWECIGSTSIAENAWKQWSEDNGSTGIGNSVYLGANNTLTRSDAYALGNGNTALITDETDYSNTDVLLLGTSNSATNAANAYQIGQHNVVTGNNLANKQYYPHQTAVNLGVYNKVNLEGVNIGKDNIAECFGVSIGQGNSSYGGSVAIGQETVAGLNSYREGAFTFGYRAEAYSGSLAIGIGNSAGKLRAGQASAYSGGFYSGGSLVVGIGELYAYGGSVGIGMAPSVPTVEAGEDPVAPASVSGSSFGIIGDHISSGDSSGNRRSVIDGQSIGVGSRNVVSGSSIVFGSCVNASSKSFVVGRDSTDIQDEGLVFGVQNNRIGSISGSVWIAGQENPDGFGGQAMAIGHGNQQIASNGIAVGYRNSLTASKAMVVGIDNSQVRNEAFAVGISCNNVYNRALAIGNYVSYVSGGSIGIGHTFGNVTESSISIGTSNSSLSGASIAMGLSNTSKAGSVVMGIANSAKGGAVMFGIGNSSVSPNQELENLFTTNGMIVGLGNKSYNIRSGWQSGDMEYRVNTFGCSVGAYIMSYGHNAFAFGMGHIVGDPNNWMNDTEVETDNDGFMTAIGYKCEALRNYDMAIGYKSKAKGGENIAITNSESLGYRNLAYNHSSVNGICNMVLNESTLICKRWDDEPLKIEYNTFNTLNNSKVVYKNTYQSEYETGVTLFGNHFESAVCELTADAWGVHSNFILGNGPEPDEEGSSSYHPDIKMQGGVISKNLIVGPTYWFDIRLGNTASDNTIEQNALLYDKIKLYDARRFKDNIVVLSEFNVQMQSIDRGDFRDNVILNSTVTGTPNGPDGVTTNGMNQNIIAGNSILYLDNTPGTVRNNMVIGTSKLTANHESPIWGSSSEGIVSNFLFGSNAKKVLACVSFGYGANADIENAMYSRNFGDNTLYNTNNVFVAGNENELNAVQHSVVFGDENMFTSVEYAGRKDLTVGMLHMSDFYVFGNGNSIRHAAGEYFSRIFITGSENTIDGNNVHDSSIFGSANNLCYFGDTLLSQMSVDDVWALSVSEPTYIEVSEHGYLPGNGTNTCDIYADNVYYYRDGAAYTVWGGAPYGVTEVEISGTNLYQGIINKTLIDGTYYKATSYPSGNSTVPELNEVREYEYCIKYPDGTTLVAQPANIGISILGNQNCVSPNVMWSHVLGTDITISNKLKYGISGLFVQGMNQTVSDGSNIICMGAGNVSSGHGSIAIGNQLISDKWQMVIGKYNLPKPGPDRTIGSYATDKEYKEGDVVYNSLVSTYYKCTAPVATVGVWEDSEWKEVEPESDKALFIIGNGYGEDDGTYWDDESMIHRSNAFEVYADGTVKAKKFVSEEPELELTEGAGIQINKNITAGTLTVSVKQPLPAAPSHPGTYALQCVVDTNGNPTYSWVSVGIANV